MALILASLLESNSMSVNSLDFSPFCVTGADGKVYLGVRPSLIPKPFKSASVQIQGITYMARTPKGYSIDQVLGYDASIRVGLNMSSSGDPKGSDAAYKLITLLNDGKKWSMLVRMTGMVEEEWI